MPIEKGNLCAVALVMNPLSPGVKSENDHQRYND